MRGFNSLVLEEQRHLKWRGLDFLEQVLMIFVVWPSPDFPSW